MNKLITLFFTLVLHTYGSQEVLDYWSKYDARSAPLNVEILETIENPHGQLYVIRYDVGELVGTNKTANPKMAAYLGIPNDATKEKQVPGIVHIHGGGQKANIGRALSWMQLGYACVSINWGQKTFAKPETHNTDWGGLAAGFIEPTHYNEIDPTEHTLFKEKHLLNSSWNLIATAGRRALTVLEEREEVDNEKLGVEGHSMGGRSTVLTAIDPRVKAAAPSVGGTGFLYEDLWGLKGSARRMGAKHDLGFFRKVVSCQSYWPHITAPTLFLQATNDFNAPMELVDKGMALLPQNVENIMSIAPHFNHRFTDETAGSRFMWMEAHLKGTFTFPKKSKAEMVFNNETGTPLFKVTPDKSAGLPLEKVEIYYGYARDPRIRFWRSAEVVQNGEDYLAHCHVFDVNEPLFAFANITYKMPKALPPRPGVAETDLLTVSSQYLSIYPEQLKQEGAKSTAKRSQLIDDFARGWQDWYLLNFENPQHWLCATRKVIDPSYMGAEGAELVVTVKTDGETNKIAIGAEVNTWQSYTGRKKDTYIATADLPKAGEQTIRIKAEDFTNAEGQKLKNWDELTEVFFSPAKQQQRHTADWNGKTPEFLNISWAGGDLSKVRPYPHFVSSGGNVGLSFEEEFQKSIVDSVKLEEQDEAKDGKK